MSWTELHYSEQAMQTIRESVRINAEKSKPLLALSKRESEVLPWLIVGKTDRDIGQILSISPKTVNFQVESIKRKYNATNRVALAYDVVLQASSGALFLNLVETNLRLPAI